MCTPTSSSCSAGISVVACVACSTGTGRVSFTQPAAASSARKQDSQRRQSGSSTSRRDLSVLSCSDGIPPRALRAIPGPSPSSPPRGSAARRCRRRCRPGYRPESSPGPCRPTAAAADAALLGVGAPGLVAGRALARHAAATRRRSLASLRRRTRGCLRASLGIAARRRRPPSPPSPAASSSPPGPLPPAPCAAARSLAMSACAVRTVESKVPKVSSSRRPIWRCGCRPPAAPAGPWPAAPPPSAPPASPPPAPPAPPTFRSARRPRRCRRRCRSCAVAPPPAAPPCRHRRFRPCAGTLAAAAGTAAAWTRHAGDPWHSWHATAPPPDAPGSPPGTPPAPPGVPPGRSAGEATRQASGEAADLRIHAAFDIQVVVVFFGRSGSSVLTQGRPSVPWPAARRRPRRRNPDLPRRYRHCRNRPLTSARGAAVLARHGNRRARAAGVSAVDGNSELSPPPPENPRQRSRRHPTTTAARHAAATRRATAARGTTATGRAAARRATATGLNPRRPTGRRTNHRTSGTIAGSCNRSGGRRPRPARWHARYEWVSSQSPDPTPARGGRSWVESFELGDIAPALVHRPAPISGSGSPGRPPGCLRPSGRLQAGRRAGRRRCPAPAR